MQKCWNIHSYKNLYKLFSKFPMHVYLCVLVWFDFVNKFYKQLLWFSVNICNIPNVNEFSHLSPSFFLSLLFSIIWKLAGNNMFDVFLWSSQNIYCINTTSKMLKILSNLKFLTSTINAKFKWGKFLWEKKMCKMSECVQCRNVTCIRSMIHSYS